MGNRKLYFYTEDYHLARDWAIILTVNGVKDFGIVGRYTEPTPASSNVGLILFLMTKMPSAIEYEYLLYLATAFDLFIFGPFILRQIFGKPTNFAIFPDECPSRALYAPLVSDPNCQLH